MNHKENAKHIFLHALDAVLPKNLVGNLSFDFSKHPKIHLYGSGKASVEMARSFETLLGKHIVEGFVVSNYDDDTLKKTTVFESTHPLPSQKSVDAAELLIKKLYHLKEDDFFIYLLSGGSSALIEKPIPPMTLEEFIKTTDLLLKHSVPIEEINIVRKHLSMIKGGQLGANIKAKGLILVISDVIGDDLSAIGSAPLYCDSSTYQDAFTILQHYQIFEKLPKRVKDIITKGQSGKIPETPKKENPNLTHHIIGSNTLALEKAKTSAQHLGYETHILTSTLEGNVKEAAKMLIKTARDMQVKDKPLALLFGGETTVTVTGTGKGGRNQELALWALKESQKDTNITFLSGGTDGIDGNSNAAGAIFDSSTLQTANTLHLNIDTFLDNNDSNTFFEQCDGLILTTPTGTNVMDIGIIIKKF